MAEEVLEIIGGKPLSGSVRIAGAKNAALPLMIATLLSSQPVELTNIPNLYDVTILSHLLESFGCQVRRESDRIRLHTSSICSSEAGYSLVKALRASFWVLAPLLARTGQARVALPGGDIIGTRGVDIHLQGLAAFGADIQLKHGTVIASAPSGLKAANINLKFPSVGATHQLLMAAALIEGTSVLRGVAREPEVVALAELISLMGATISGAGTDEIIVSGRKELGAESKSVISMPIIGDRIEAGTYLCCALAAHTSLSNCSDISIDGINPEHLRAVIDLLKSKGARLEETANSIKVVAGSKLEPISCSTEPFPGFPTDLQAPFCALLACIEGQSSIEETIYDGRVGHVAELARMGVQISFEDRQIIVKGGTPFSGTDVEGVDIRGAAALVVAALVARGTTVIHAPGHLRRGYENIEEKLGGLGASIRKSVADQEDFAFAGC